MKEYFSFSLFKDAMKQLRVHGFVFLIVVCFPVFFGGMFSDVNNANIPVSYLAILSFPVIAPIMTFYLFGFLNRRNSSDFYHAIPKSRTCVYISYISAIMAWITSILLFSTVLAFALFQLQKHTTKIQKINVYSNVERIIEYEIAYKETALLLCSLLICSLLVVAVITIGMSLSGTAFTGMAIAGMVLFFPSVLLLFIDGHIGSIAPYTSPEHFFFLINTELDNMVAGSVASIFGVGGYWDFEDIFLNGFKMIYTFLLSVIYLIIGGILFHKRKSECAGFSSVYPKVQTTIRCLCCVTFSLIPLSLLFEKMTNTYYYNNYTDIVMLYLIAIIIYFMFELISTKRVKNLVKAIPGLLIVVASNVVLYLIILGAVSVASRFQPDAEDIDYVVIKFESSDREYFYVNEYLTQLASDCKIEDSEIRHLASSCLKATIENHDSDLEDYYFYDEFCFGICVDGKMTYRNIQLSNSNKTRLFNLIYSNTDVYEKYFKIPKPSKKDLYIHDINKSVLSADKRLEIYDCFMEEVDTLPKTTKEMILLGASYESTIDLPEAQQNMERFYLTQVFKYHNEDYYYRYEITPITPKSYNMILQALTEHFMKYINNPELLKEEQRYTLRVYSSKPNIGKYIESSETDFFNNFFEAAKSNSDVPTVEDTFYLIKDHSSDYNFIGALMASKELDAFMSSFVEDDYPYKNDYNEYYYD